MKHKEEQSENKYIYRMKPIISSNFITLLDKQSEEVTDVDKSVIRWSLDLDEISQAI